MDVVYPLDEIENLPEEAKKDIILKEKRDKEKKLDDEYASMVSELNDVSSSLQLLKISLSQDKLLDKEHSSSLKKKLASFSKTLHNYCKICNRIEKLNKDLNKIEKKT